MRKQLALGLGLAVIAAPAFASKARLQALGEDIYGSYYVNDLRNVFLNAAQVNNHKDTVTMEWGNTDSDKQDVQATPKAEGGVFFGHGNMVYGLYLGAESNTTAALRDWALVSNKAAQEGNAVDLFVAGDAGIKWGAALHYSKSAKNEVDTTDSEQNAMAVKLGVHQGNWQAFANISLANKAEDGTNEFKGGTGAQIGGSYNLNDYTLFVEHRMIKGENAGDQEVEISKTMLGVGRAEKLNDKATLFTKATYTMFKCDNEGAASTDLNCLAGTDKTTKGTDLPITIGLEYDAASWLSLRGSISQSIMSSVKVDGKKTANYESTAVNAGASLKFGDFTVDGVIGNDKNETSNGDFNTDNLMSRVSFTYKF